MLKVIEVGLVGVQEVINGYQSCLLVPKGLYSMRKQSRLTIDGVVHETLTIKDIDSQILRETRVLKVIEVGLVGVQEVINGYRSCLLVPKGLYYL